MPSARPAHILDALPPWLKKAAPYIALVLAVLAAYANVYGNEFLYDDETLIVNNAFLRSWHFLPAIFMTSTDAGADVSSSYYRPMPTLLDFIVVQLAGLSLFAFHFLNIALHAANACLVYVLGRKLKFNSWAVFAAALVWAVHPAHTEIITYMSGTADPLYVFFCLLGVIVLLPDFAARKFLYAVPLFLLGLLSKEDALTFPLLVMSCIFLLDKKRFQLRTYARTWVLWIIAIIYALGHAVLFPMAVEKMAPGAAAAMPQYLLPPLPYTFFATLPTYFGILFWPSHLHFERSFPAFHDPWNVPVLLGVAMFALAVYQVIWRQDRRNLPLSWGLLWFISAYALHTGLLFTASKPLYEHWMYLPSVGLFLGIAQTLALQTDNNPAMLKHARVWTVCAGLIALAFGWHTWIQNRVWRDADSLYGNVFADGETSPNAHNNLGIAYARRGEYKKAVEQFQLAIRTSGDTVTEAQYNLGATLLIERKDKAAAREAAVHLLRALEIDPDYYSANLKLAECYDRLGNKTSAARYRQRAAEIHKKFTSSGL